MSVPSHALTSHRPCITNRMLKCVFWLLLVDLRVSMTNDFSFSARKAARSGRYNMLTVE
jgi:hypothetical protein